MIVVSLVLALGGAYGYVCWLLPSGRRDWPTLILTTMAASLGGLTLLMFWIALLAPGRLGLGLALVGALALGLLGLGLGRGALRPDVRWNAPPRGPGAWELLAVTTVTSLVIVFNAAYWPFKDWDSLAVYAPIARTIHQTGRLPIGDGLYEAYPMLIPLAYAYSFWASGGVDEYLARALAALMAVAAVGSAGVLAARMATAWTGLLAGGLVATTPAFCRWASSGYADVPVSFMVALATLHVWRWWRSNDGRSGALTGVAAGLAMWTKNSSLTLIVSLSLLVGLRWWAGRRSPRLDPMCWRPVAAMAAMLALVAGPWYVRNAIVFHLVVPDTIWTHLARRTEDTLLALARGTEGFGVPGWLYTVAPLFAVVPFARGGAARDAWIILLAVVGPFVGAWWWLASYETRFLLAIVPLLAVMAALMVQEIVAVVSTVFSPAWGRRASWLVVLAVLAMTPTALRKAVDHGRSILANPWMSDAAKHRLQIGGLYDLALGINALPAGSRVGGVPSRARIHITPDRFALVDGRPISGPPCRVSAEYDFVVYEPRALAAAEPGPAAKPILRTADGYTLYATRDGEPCPSSVDVGRLPSRSDR